MTTGGEDLYDLHNHLLFGIDDGAKNLSATEAMLQEAVKNRIKVIVATPHMRAHTNMLKYEANFPIAAETASRYGIKLLRGAEYSAHSFPENPPYIALGGGASGTVLIDFRMPILPPEFQLFVDNIFNAGYTPMIAHPERTFPESMLRELERLADSGVTYQVTSGSLLGKFGSAPRKMGWQLLQKGWAKIIASDAHDTADRNCCLLEAYEAVSRKFGNEAAKVLQENARRLIEEPHLPLLAMPTKKRALKLFGWLKKH